MSNNKPKQEEINLGIDCEFRFEIDAPDAKVTVEVSQ